MFIGEVKNLIISSRRLALLKVQQIIVIYCITELADLAMNDMRPVNHTDQLQL